MEAWKVEKMGNGGVQVDEEDKTEREGEVVDGWNY
jgi:hypothetical protein